MTHWQRELTALELHLAGRPNNDYRSWQPTKWQSLETVRDRLLTHCWDRQPGPGATALELGCGSATLLIQLVGEGVRGIGVDRDPGALRIARRAAESLGMKSPELIDADFLDPAQRSALPRADLVFHIGVIEHLDEKEQLDMLRLSAELSQRWILVGIPHEHGPVFSGFLKAVTAAGAVYDDDHHHIDVPALVERAGHRLVHADGLHLFYRAPDLYVPGDLVLDNLYDRLRPRLVALGGSRFAAFPQLAFTPADIPVLRTVEEELTPTERYAYGFLRYFLIEKCPALTSVEDRAVTDRMPSSRGCAT